MEHMLYRAKYRALKVLVEKHERCFKTMRTYANMILLTNPGSRVVISTVDPNMTFNKMFVCYNAQRLGFRQCCRPFIGIDGIWLKSPFKGCLLSAVGLDANSGSFLIVVVVCEGESDKTWGWFLSNMKKFLDFATQKPVCIMSDGGKPILKMVPSIWPEASHM